MTIKTLLMHYIRAVIIIKDPKIRFNGRQTNKYFMFQKGK